MNHLGTVQIETDRLILRRFVISDAQAVFDNWANDTEVTKYLTWPAHASADVSYQVVLSWVEGYAQDRSYQWAMTLKENGDAPIGSIGVVNMREDIDMVTIGYCIGRKWWRQGITSEAFAGIIPFLIEQVGVNRIEARHDPRNPNSGSVMKKCGLRYEGTLRSASMNTQGICDSATYGLLAADYYAAKQGYGDIRGTKNDA